MVKLSEYSILFKNLNENDAIKNSISMENKLEEFRLSLDLKYIKRFLHKKTLLDFPIGTGRIYQNFLDTHDVWGYDICKEYIKLAKKKNPLISSRFKVSSLENIEHKKKFDNIITLRTLNNVNDLDKVFFNIHNILNKNGRFFFNIHLSTEQLKKKKNFNRFKIIFKKNYDYHTGTRSMKGFENRLYSFIRKHVSKIPFFLLNLNDFIQINILKKNGIQFYVVEKL
jgi:ubiquinone/menaquinone biosynthesis C-methylase UbiE